MDIKFLNTHTIELQNQSTLDNYVTANFAFDVEPLNKISLKEYGNILANIEAALEAITLQPNMLFNVELHNCDRKDFIAYSEYIMSFIIKMTVNIDKPLKKRIYYPQRKVDLKWNDIFLLTKFSKRINNVGIVIKADNMINTLEAI